MLQINNFKSLFEEASFKEGTPVKKHDTGNQNKVRY
jgi:hypothetical protein